MKAACTALLMTTGFGIATVQACATELYARHLGVSLSEAFVPSSRWCYDFLRNIMHLKGIEKASNALTKVFEAINVVIASCEEKGCLRKAADWTAIRECVEAAAVPTADPTLLKIVAPTGSRRM